MMIGKITTNGSSVDDLPKKYEDTLYILALYSLKNTALSAGNVSTTDIALDMNIAMQKKRRQPLIS